MKSHEYYMDLCSAMIDGQISDEEKEELGVHLETCSECKEYMRMLQEMQVMLADDEISVPSSLHDSIMSTLEKEVKVIPSKKEKRRVIPMFSMLAAAAATIMLVASGTLGDMISTGSTGITTETVLESTTEDTGTAIISRTMDLEESGDRPVADIELEQAVVEPEFTDEPNEETDADVNVAETMPLEEVSPTLVGLPEAIASQSFTSCYTATGDIDNVPAFDGVIIAEDEKQGVYYFAVQNNMNVIETVLNELKQAGFAISVSDTTYEMIIEADAENMLLVLNKVN